MQSQALEIPSVEFGCEHDCCGQVNKGDCVDLQAEFGRLFLVEVEDDAFSGTSCPWHRQVRCRNGHIGVSGGRKLHAYADGPTRARLHALAEAAPDRFSVAQHGDTEIVVAFEVEEFSAVAAIMSPLRRKRG